MNRTASSTLPPGQQDRPPPRAKRGVGLALYSQVYLTLKERIANGSYALELPLPTEDQLAAEFSVSRITARRAVLELVAEGLLTRTAGKGTFLTSQPTLRRMVSPLSLDEQLKREAEETRVELLAMRYVVAAPAVATLLDLAQAGAEVQHSTRLRTRADSPMMLLDGYVPASIGRRFPRNALKTKPLHQCLKEAGHPLVRLVQEFSALSATPPFSDWLRVAPGSPLGLIERLGFDQHGTAVQYLRMYFSPERVRLRTSSTGVGGQAADAGQFVFR